jgi:hypothetical protein
MQQLSAVVVEVVEAVADTLCLTLNRNLNLIQIPQRSITPESSCCPEGSLSSCLPTHLQAVLATSQQPRICIRHNT